MNHFKHIQVLAFVLLAATGLSYGQIDPNSIGVIITNESTINTKDLEYSPAFYEDGVVFISTKVNRTYYKVMDKKINKNIMSIYWAQRDSLGVLMAPVPFADELLSRIHEGPVTFDRTGEMIFFTRNNNVKGKRKRSSDGIAKLKIYSAIKTGNIWTSIEDLPFNDEESSTCHPAISVEGDLLYFASDRPEGLGGMDLYVVKRVGDEWGAAKNLGPGINTPGNEVFPYIHADGTFYFASDGHIGLGGLDLFYAKQTGDNFEQPVNLKEPFNSEADDFGFIVDRDQKNGYFSSNREGGLGDDDIYNFYITGNKSLVGGTDKTEALRQTKLSLKVIDRFSAAAIPDASVTAMSLDGLASNKVITDNSGTIGTLIPVGSARDNLILQLSVDDSEQAGLTDLEGRIDLVLKGEQNIVNIIKQGYQTKQVALSGYSEGEEVLVELETSTNCIPLKGEATSSIGTPLAGAIIDILGEDEIENQKITVDKQGKFEYCLRRNKLYIVSLIVNGAMVDQKSISTINTDANDAVPLVLIMNVGGTVVLKKGTTIELPNIYYNFNDASIRPDARKDLDFVASLMDKYPSMTIDLGSHTDSRGGTRYNKQLSQKRANQAVKYIVSKGIRTDRITATGYGESELRNKCSDGVRCWEKEHQFNRRTEIKVTRFDNSSGEVKFISTTGIPSVVEEPKGNTITVEPRDYAVGGQRASGSDSFLVIVGTFQVLENAQTRLAQVKELGFSDAEIVDMEINDYRAVSVGVFDNDADAKELVKTLKDQYKLRSYIKRMKN